MTAVRPPKRKSYVNPLMVLTDFNSKNFRKSELHAEINSLKRQLGSCANTLNSVPYIQSPEPPDPYPIISSLSQAPNSPSLTKIFPSTADQSSSREGVDGQSPTALDVPIQAQNQDPTKSRKLNDFTVTEIEIDDCFTQLANPHTLLLSS